MESSDSEDELFPIEFSGGSAFKYDDPLLVSGVLRAVVEDDIDKVKILVESGKSVNINDNNGNTPLHVAVIKNNLEILEFLLQQEETMVNVRNFLGQTPLLQAAKNGRIECAEKLIAAGASVNLSTLEDVTPLHVSVTHPNLAHLLVSKGALLDARDYSGDTPLHDAVTEGCHETVYMLLYHNADANAEGGNRLTPFMHALITGNIEIQEALFEYVDDFKSFSWDGMSTLCLALTNATPYVAEIIKRGGEVDESAFHACLSSPNLVNFELVWDRLNDSEVIRISYMFENLDSCFLASYIDIIIESSNFKIFAESVWTNYSYTAIISRYAKLELSLDQLSRLTYVWLTHGYLMSYDDVYEILVHFGNCDLMKLLLYMKLSDDHVSLPLYITPRLFFDVENNTQAISEHAARYYKSIGYFGKEKLKKDLEISFDYCLNHKLLEIYCDEFRIPSQSAYFSNLFKVPMLIELSRNKCREHIINKFKIVTASNYYTIVDHLNIAIAYKKILKYEKQLYQV